MPLLFWSTDHPHHWVAYSQTEGWLQFPARENGWDLRTPVSGLDPRHIEKLPAQRAFGTGFPGAAEFYGRKAA